MIRITTNGLLSISALFLLIHANATCQPYRNLIFEGAGIRGVAYVGAIKELENRNMLQNIERVGGTSAGAIAALALSLKYNAGEIEHILLDTKLQKFNDGKLFFMGGISRMNRNYGWYRGQAFTAWLEEIIVNKTGQADITFQELHDQNFRDLYVSGTSLNRQQLIVFSYQNYPTMKVKDAVRISMSIPFYFEAVYIDSTGQVINKKKPPGYFDIMVDGGITGNFPIAIFDNTDYNQVRSENFGTMGFRIDTPMQIIYDADHKGLAPQSIPNFKNYLAAFYSYMLENLNRTKLTENDWRRTVSISCGTISSKIRRLSMEEKSTLIQNGQIATQNFLNSTENRAQ